jgi:ribosomal protein S18 acetylase RimI-like enzyme
MVSITRPPSPSPSPRPMNPFRDWSGVAQLMRVAFQSEVSAASLPLLPDWPGLRWVNGLIGAFEALGMETPEQMLGYVWEESGRIVGNATIGLSHGPSGTWLLSNVAVHPDYRRRGIARALVETAIKEVRRHGGRYLTLQVQSDNLGARQLYETLGFRTLEQTSEFIGVNLQGPKVVPVGVTLASPTREQWTAVQAMVAAHLPEALRAYRHSIAGLFQIPYQRSALGKVSEVARGVQYANWCVLRDGAVVGGVVMQVQLSWGSHRASVFVQPNSYGQVEEAIVARAAQHIQHYASRRVTFGFPGAYVDMAWALRQRGLREVRMLDLMLLPLT